jgi:hypothetical protein
VSVSTFLFSGHRPTEHVLSKIKAGNLIVRAPNQCVSLGRRSAINLLAYAAGVLNTRPNSDQFVVYLFFS